MVKVKRNLIYIYIRADNKLLTKLPRRCINQHSIKATSHYKDSHKTTLAIKKGKHCSKKKNEIKPPTKAWGRTVLV